MRRSTRSTRATLLASALVLAAFGGTSVLAPGCAEGTSASSGGMNTGGAAGSGGSGEGGIAQGGAAGHGGMGQGGQAGQGGTAGQGGAGVCNLGEEKPCYSGDPATLGIGTCVGGTYPCVEGQWDTSSCMGEILPSGAPELCDGEDEDCNGQTDDGIPSITCGLGACQVTVAGCLNGAIPACTPLTPSPVEKCDGTDDDCDGTIDNGCDCQEGMTQDCYSGGAGTIGVGVCAPGTMTCVGGKWGACIGEVVPSTELCDAKDNDCDGQTDENLGQTTCGAGACLKTVNNCVNGVPQTCTPLPPSVESCNGIDDDCNLLIDDGLGSLICGVGACQNTVAACVAGQAQSCVPKNPVPESCDGKDNDCDGIVDDGNPDGGGVCTTNLPGVCAPGTQVCSNGMLTCVSNVQPSPETCNAKDDNCNGAIDEGNPGGGQACNTGKLGICAQGITACQNGSVVCSQVNQASVEVCDGIDNNCNGAVDEMNPGGGGACSTGQPGVCAAGTYQCQNGALSCVQTTQATIEICDGKDNDCNGTIDDGNPGSGGSCTTGLLGVCAAGTYQCQGGQLKCVQTTQASNETCNGKDDNCNGSVDEMNPGGGGACVTGLPGVCSAGVTTCTNGTLICQQSAQPSSEICDGKDNNCNGVVDDGNPGGGVACGTGLPGVCAAGTTTCSNGAILCQQTTQSSPETCDGKDNNCNGQTDEGNPGGGLACTVAGQQGVCAAGTTSCTGGGVICTQNTTAMPEVCDGLDNDCNGQVDNGNPGGGQACAVSGQLGTCAVGATSCTSGVLTCPQTVFPVSEVCGDGKDNDCNGTVDNGCNSCAHSVCTAGSALTTGCNSCVTAICATTGFTDCCGAGGSWGNKCTAAADAFCGAGTCCAHDVCTTGGPLSSSCSSCVAALCAADSFCCTTGWDSLCVDKLPTYCGVQCN